MLRLSSSPGAAPDVADAIPYEELAAVLEEPEALAAVEQQADRIRAESEARLKEAADALSAPLRGGPAEEAGGRGSQGGRAEHPHHWQEITPPQQPQRPGR